jgi:hypothetical protein
MGPFAIRQSTYLQKPCACKQVHKIGLLFIRRDPEPNKPLSEVSPWTFHINLRSSKTGNGGSGDG